MIIGDGIMLGAGGETASIVVTAPTGSTVTCTTPAGIVLTAAEVDGTWTFAKLMVYGTYTITATDGTNTKTLDVLVDAAYIFNVEIVLISAYRYIRWQITKIKSSSLSVLQASEFGFRDVSGTRFSWPSATNIQAPTGDPGEGVSNLIDNNTSTKYYVGGISFPLVITFDLGGGNTINLEDYSNYYYYTANDVEGRDPISWILSVSNDGADWKVVDTQNDLSITSMRKALAGVWEVTL